MAATIQILFTACVVLLVYRVYSSIQHVRRCRRFAAQHGCADPPVLPSRLPGGVDYLWRLLTFKGDDLIDGFLMAPAYTLGNTFEHTVLGARCVWTAEPRNFQAILATNFKDWEMGHVRRKSIEPLLGHSVFISDGPPWERARAQLKPIFSRSQINDFEDADYHVQILLRCLPTDKTGWTADVDVIPMLFRFAFDAATEFLYGKSTNTQLAHIVDSSNPDDARSNEDKRNEASEFSEAFDLVTEYIMLRVFLGKAYFLGTSRKYRKSLAMIHRFVDGIVDNALHPEKRTVNKAEAEETGRADKIVFLDELARTTQDPQELRQGILNLLVTGRDTTSTLLGWVLFWLARYPKIYEKLRCEVLAEFGPYDEGVDRIDFARLKSVKMLQWVIFEALRVSSAVPLNNRVAARDTVLPVGGGPDGSQPIAVMKGDMVQMLLHVAQRREDLWGADAKEYKPMRWDGRHMGWDYIPFSGGRRVCIGQQHALAETSFVIVRFCQRFDKIEHTDEWDNKVKTVGLTTMPGRGVNVRLHRAES